MVPLLIIMAILIAVVALVLAIVNSFKQVSKAQENIIENNNKIYETTQKQSGLEELIEEYEELDKKVNKTITIKPLTITKILASLTII
jgi:predicted Holliday junction resolvase-like endonuclease